MGHLSTKYLLITNNIHDFLYSYPFALFLPSGPKLSLFIINDYLMSNGVNKELNGDKIVTFVWIWRTTFSLFFFSLDPCEPSDWGLPPRHDQLHSLLARCACLTQHICSEATNSFFSENTVFFVQWQKCNYQELKWIHVQYWCMYGYFKG